MKKLQRPSLRNTRLLVLAIVVLAATHGVTSAQSGMDKTEEIQRASLDSLTQAIARRCTTDSARAYEIYKWIAQNISYDFATFTGKENPYKKIEDVYTGYKLTPRRTKSLYNDQVAFMVLQRRKAICDGYARLFAALCHRVSIEVALISGYGKTIEDPIGRPFKADHAWNAVRLSGKWKLVDACWGSGYAMRGSHRFIRHFRPEYFCTPPNLFILDHYPEDTSWTLLDSNMSLQDFFSWPCYEVPVYGRANIASVTPSNGLIRTKAGSTIVFRIIGKDSLIAPSIELEKYAGVTTTLYYPDGPTAASSSVMRPEKISMKQGAAVDAIFSYLDTVKTDGTIETSAPKLREQVSHEEKVKVEGKTFEYRYRISPRDRFIYFYNNSELLVTYAVEVVK